MKKKFDCVAMKQAAQDRIRREVAGMTRAEEIAYFRAGGAEFRRRIKEARRLARLSRRNTSQSRSRVSHVAH